MIAAGESGPSCTTWVAVAVDGSKKVCTHGFTANST
jgi:hypothetical protein